MSADESEAPSKAKPHLDAAAQGSERTKLDYETAMDFRQTCKSLTKAAKHFEDACKVFSQQGSLFAEEILRLVPKVGKQSHLAPALVYFGNTLVAVSSVQDNMLTEVNNNFCTPMNNFADYDFAELADAKKKLDKAKFEYDQHVERVAAAIRSKKATEKKLETFEVELSKLKDTVDAATVELNMRLDELNVKRETKFLRFLSMFMTAQQQYFTRGSKLFQNLKPRMDAIQKNINEMDTQKGGIKEGHLQKKRKNPLGGWQRNYYVLKEGWLFSYKNKMELDESNALNIMLCSVRVPIVLPHSPQLSHGGADPSANCRFEILNPAKKYPIILQAESEKERNEWVAAIQHAISSSLNAQSVGQKVDVTKRTTYQSGDQRPLKILQKVPGNTLCADCNTPDPDWISINLGVLVCKDCSGVHRSLGTHISKVRSLTLDKWSPFLLWFMKSIGNTKFNELYEKHITEGAEKPTPKSDRFQREKWIKAKYKTKEFLPKIEADLDTLHHMLFDCVSTGPVDPMEMLHLIAQGADVNYVARDRENRTPLHEMVLNRDDINAAEILLQNGADLFKKDKRGWTAMHYCSYLNKIRSAKIILKGGFEPMKDKAMDKRGRLAQDLAILNHSRETESLLRGENIETGSLTFEDVENGILPEYTTAAPMTTVLPPIRDDEGSDDDDLYDDYDSEEDLEQTFHGGASHAAISHTHTHHTHHQRSDSNSQSYSNTSYAPPSHSSHSHSHHQRSTSNTQQVANLPPLLALSSNGSNNTTTSSTASASSTSGEDPPVTMKKGSFQKKRASVVLKLGKKMFGSREKDDSGE